MATQNSSNQKYTNQSDGFTLGGGSTQRDLTVTGANITLAGSGSNTHTFPSSSDTLVGRNSTDTLANKTLNNTNTVTVKDANLTIQDDGDTTKQLKFQLSGITTGTTRTITAPDASGTITLDGYVPGGTDVAIADGGTGASTADGARYFLNAAKGIPQTNTTGSQGYLLAKGLLQTHPETGEFTTIPHVFNDIAYNNLRGGSVTITKNAVDVTNSPDGGSVANMFTPDVASISYSVASTSDVFVVTVNFHTGFTFGQMHGITMVPWGAAQDCTIELWDSTDSVWRTTYAITNNAMDGQHWGYDIVTPSGHSVTKARYTLTNINNTQTRISQIAVYHYGGSLASGPFLPRGGGALYGSSSAGPSLSAAGSDSNIQFNIYPKGTSSFLVRNSASDAVVFEANPVASGVNYISVQQGTTGNPARINSWGSDSDVGINLVPRGTGTVQANGVEVATISGTQTITNKTVGNTNTVTVKDANFTVQDDSDTTKQLKLQLSGITTGTTRTLTAPDADGTIALAADTDNSPRALEWSGTAWPNRPADSRPTIHVGETSTAPTDGDLQVGDLWFYPDDTTTFTDDTFALQDNIDNTKQLQFQLSGISTGTTRTLTVPNADTTVVGTDVTQTLTNKNLTSATNTFPSTLVATTGAQTISGKTLTAPIISAQTTSAGSAMKLTTGALMTTAEAGAFEYNASTFYLSPGASNRAVNIVSHIITQTASFTGSNVNTAQPWFNSVTNGTITLPATTSYIFEGVLQLARSAGTTSHTLGILFGGTATLTSIDYTAYATTTSGNVLGTVSAIRGTAATSTVVTAASTSATENNTVTVKGIVRINAGGTFIPQFIYSVAPGGAPTIARNTYFTLNPIGTNTIAAIGNWS